MTPEKAALWHAQKHERAVQKRMIELRNETRDGWATPANRSNFEAVQRLIAEGVREVVETSTDAKGRVETRHRLVRGRI
jgi:arabinogalactan endo-1,4-beta-galactosidase